jgi:hypothetical protein
MINKSIFKFIVLTTAVWPLSCLAYIDPGSGFVLWQGLIALLGVGIMFIKNPIRVIKDWMARRRKR